MVANMSREVKFLLEFLRSNKICWEAIKRRAGPPVGQIKTTNLTQYTILKCQTPRAHDPGLDLTRQEQ